MKRLWYGLVFALMLWAPPATAARSAAVKLKLPTEFTAQILVERPNNPSRTGTIFFSHGRIRTEMINPGAAHPLITVIRPGQGRVFILFPEDHAFALEPYTARDIAMALAMARGAKAIPEGNETVGADDCNKYQVLSKDPQIRSIELWVSKTSNLPAKLVVTDATTSESTLFLNAAAGRQPAMLFDPPPDYREVAPAAASAKAN